jgi:hypothetical protein
VAHFVVSDIIVISDVVCRHPSYIHIPQFASGGKYQKTIRRRCASTMVVCVVVIRLLFAFLRLHRGFIEHECLSAFRRDFREQDITLFVCFSGFCVTVLRIGWCGSALLLLLLLFLLLLFLLVSVI